LKNNYGKNKNKTKLEKRRKKFIGKSRKSKRRMGSNSNKKKIKIEKINDMTTTNPSSHPPNRRGITAEAITFTPADSQRSPMPVPAYGSSRTTSTK
jgi:hypothetical protein